MVDAPSTSDLRSALDDVALLGPFYAATANPAEVVDDSWRPLRALYSDPEPLAARIDQVAAALGTEDQRVAASITYQGLAARLVSPLIALAAVHGLTATWSPDTLYWRRAVTGPWPLWESDECPRAPSAAELPDAVAEALVEPHLVTLASAVRAQVAVSEKTLRGNAASAVVAAGRLVARCRPGYSAAAWTVVRHLLGTEGLAESGVFTTGWGFRRRSCCLYYRVPGGGVCGDCVLAGRQ